MLLKPYGGGHPFSDTTPELVDAGSGSSGSNFEVSRDDHIHQASTAAPSQGIGGGNSEGVAETLARSDHDHTLRETGGPSDLTFGSVSDQRVIKRSGTSLIGGHREYPDSDTDPVSPAPSDGDLYYNTVHHLWLMFDGSRSKWLSFSESRFEFGNTASTPPGAYYKMPIGITFTSTRGFVAPCNGTIIGLGYFRVDSDAATYEVTSDGVSIATLASSATQGTSLTLNANFSANAVLGVRNQTGGNVVGVTAGWVCFRWRA